MNRDATQEGEHEGLPTSGHETSGDSDFEDSFLGELSRAEPLPLLPRPGEALGGPDGRRYEVLEWMGGGGMGEVFRARDETLRREVALKFLLPHPGREAEALVEARAVARLDQENIVRIFDVAEWRGIPGVPGVPFLVMECLEGEPLDALLKRGHLEVERALEVLEDICTGLTHAHERGIVHRDLKPGNVFLTREGTVKLLDFGLSHLMVASTGSAPHLAMAGTPAYMAPEQWRGEAQDARTDIWAAGVVLYEMLSGEPPFAGNSLEELRGRVTSEEPAPSVRAHNPEVPPEVESLLATALAKDPARRFPTARELRREVHEQRARLLGPELEAPELVVRQRRHLLLLCCQLTGLSGLVGRLDAEDLGELEVAFQQACEEVIRQYGGRNLSLGSEVFAGFGCPRVREDDSEQAVRAALHLAHAIPELLQRRLPHLSLPGLGAKVGLHTDRMVLGLRAMQGEALRVASWLVGQAGPGEVLASEATWRLVRGAFETECLGARDFTGLAGTARTEVHRVLREREVRVRFERTLVAGGLTPLVGRERELGQLLSLWARAREGHGAFVLVRGEAGIGKSRLLQELRERVPPETATRLRFQCWFRLSASVFPPVAETLQHLLQFSPEGTPQRHLEEMEVQLGAMGLSEEHVQLLGLLLSLPVPEDSPVYRLTPRAAAGKDGGGPGGAAPACGKAEPGASRRRGLALGGLLLARVPRNPARACRGRAPPRGAQRPSGVPALLARPPLAPPAHPGAAAAGAGDGPGEGGGPRCPAAGGDGAGAGGKDGWDSTLHRGDDAQGAGGRGGGVHPGDPERAAAVAVGPAALTAEGAGPTLCGGGAGVFMGDARGVHGARALGPAARAGGTGGGGAVAGGAGRDGRAQVRVPACAFPGGGVPIPAAKREETASPAPRASAGGALPRGGGGKARGTRLPLHRGGRARAGHSLLVPGRDACLQSPGPAGNGGVPLAGAGTAAQPAGAPPPCPGAAVVDWPGLRPIGAARVRLAGSDANVCASLGAGAADGRAHAPARIEPLADLHGSPSTGGLALVPRGGREGGA